MKNLNKILALTLVFIMVFSACTNVNNQKDINLETDKPKIAFIPQLIGIPYFTAMERGGNEAAEKFGAEFIYSGSVEVSAAEQVKIMDSLIRQGVDAISVSVLDSSSINPIIKKAKDDGIKVFTSDSDSPDSERDVYVAQALDKDLGYTLIDRLAMQIGNKGKIGIVSGDPTATNLNAWVDYMKEKLEEDYPDIELVDVRYASTSEESLKQSQELITRYPDLKGLVAVASINIPGVAQAVEQTNNIGKISVIGYGSPQTVKPYIESGAMEESILWNAKDLGYLVVWAGLQLIEGNEFQETNNVDGLSDPVIYMEDEKILLLGPPLIINKDNVDTFDF